jgi:mono/diheme cytochrome c family protein
MTPPIPSQLPPPPHRRTRSKTPRLIALAILATIAIASFVSFIRGSAQRAAAHTMTNPVPATPDGLLTAKSNYGSHCASCHGSAGDGKGDKAQGLWTAPTDFRSAAQMSHRTDGDLYWTTTKGNWPMPAFEKQLTDLERWQLVDYIRTFAEAGAPPATPVLR